MKSSLGFRPQLELIESRLVPAAPAHTPASVPPPSSNPADYDLVLTNVCEDPVGIKILADGEKTKDFFDKDGNLTRSITTGVLKVQVVDLKTLDSLVLNVSGPQVVSANGTATTSGPWLFYFPGVFIILIALTVNFIGDGLRDAFDPTQTRVRA